MSAQSAQSDMLSSPLSQEANSQRVFVWRVLAGFALLLLIHLISYLLTPVEDNLLFRVACAVAAVVCGVAVPFALWVTPERTADMRLKLSRWHDVFVVSIFGLMAFVSLVPIPPTVRAHLIHTHTTLTLLLLTITAYVTLFNGAVSVRRVRLWVVVALIGALLVLFIRALTLSYAPFIDWQDEAQVMNWALHFLRTGSWGDPTFVGLGDSYYAYPRFYLLFAGWYNLFGATLWTGRLFALLFMLPIIGLTYLAARNLFGKTVGFFSALALFCSAIFMTAARIRHDLGLTLCLAAALYLYSEALKSRQARTQGLLHIAAGFISALGISSHFHGGGFTSALLISLYLPRYLSGLKARRYFPEDGFWAFGVGAAAGAVIVFIVQFLPSDLQGFLYAFSQQTKYSDGGSELVWAFFGHFINIGFLSVLELLLILAGVAAAIIRRRPLDWMLISVFLVTQVALAVMASGAIYYYVVPLTPVYAMLIGNLLVGRSRVIDDHDAQQEERWWGLSAIRLPRAVPVVFALLIIPLLGRSFREPLQFALELRALEREPLPAVTWIRGYLPASLTVVGDMRYGLWLHNYTFSSHLTPRYLYEVNDFRFGGEDGVGVGGPLEPVEEPTEVIAVWEAVNADVYIIDPTLVRSYKFFQPLVDTGYFEANGYVLAAEFSNVAYGGQEANGSSLIYVREAAFRAAQQEES